MKGIKTKTAAILQGLTTARVAVCKGVLSIGNNLLTQASLIGKKYIKHLSNTKYCRYVFGEHTCLNAKFTHASLFHSLKTYNENQGSNNQDYIFY